MSNISNTNSTYTTGGIDTQTTLDGTYEATFQQMNGAASGVIAVETVLGDGPTLKGNKADLVTRLAEVIDADGKLIGHSTGAHTNTVADGGKISAETSGTPAAGIGTALLFQAESQDEAPSDILRVGGVFDDVGTASEDSRFVVWLRVAGAALARVYEWVATTGFKAVFTHSNSADRTYSLPDATTFLSDWLRGPASTGAGSTAAHEGSVTISTSQALSGVHFYTDFTLDAGDTLTIADNAGRLCIVATGAITINGTIDGIGAGGLGGAGGDSTSGTGDGINGGPGTSQPGGGGGAGSVATGKGGDGGDALPARGGVGATLLAGAGAQGQNNTGALIGITHPFGIYGGGGGGGGGARVAAADGSAGGNGGASIVLVAPTVILGAASVFNTSGVAGANNGSTGGGGGGGSAGNVYVFTRSFTDNGATFTMTAGSGGTSVSGGAGAAGRAGVKQVLIYA